MESNPIALAMQQPAQSPYAPQPSMMRTSAPAFGPAMSAPPAYAAPVPQPTQLQSNDWQSQWANIPTRGPGQMGAGAGGISQWQPPPPQYNAAPRPMAGYAPPARPQRQMGYGPTSMPTPGVQRGATAIEGPGNPIQRAMQGGAMMSDETRKVTDQRTMADEFLDHMRPYSYRYKDPAQEPRMIPTGGRYLGVMAQDLEKVPGVGHQLVMDTPQGKMVDQKTALSATLAGLARLNERVRALEGDATGGPQGG